jgi:transcriptional regulator with XRE-family HTH domain
MIKKKTKMTNNRSLKEDANINKIVGEKIRQLRLANGWSRTQVVRHIGVSNQQLLKYETGENRVSTGRLTLIAKVFQKPLSYFYDQYEVDNDTPKLSNKIGADLYSNFMKLKSEKLKKSISNLLRNLVEEQDNE